jgi:hypothetical protein
VHDRELVAAGQLELRTMSRSEKRSPHATLKTRPETPGTLAASRFARTTFVTYVKSRDCSPSP